jgi:hypothetical protein
MLWSKKLCFPYGESLLTLIKETQFPMSSKIQIDTSLFLPKIDNYTDRRQVFGRQQREVSRLTIQYAQEWLDWMASIKPSHPLVTEIPDTQRKARRMMAHYVKAKLKLQDRHKGYFVPSFIWQWIAGKVIAYVIKLIIEHYWPDLIEEWKIDI